MTELINQIIQGDALKILKTLPNEFIDCIITSPPYYGLRDYGVAGQIGLESTLNEYLNNLLAITAELKRVLKKTGTMWWNHGDSYGTGSGAGVRTGKQATNVGSTNWYEDTGKASIPGYEKSLILQAHRLAIRMIDEQGWILRNTIIWHKSNVMPSSVEDRFTVDYEPIFFFSKNKNYWFEQQFERQYDWGLRDRSNFRNATDDPLLKQHGLTGELNPLGRNKRTVWKIPTQPFSEAHFATFPKALVVTPIKAGCPEFICKQCSKAREKIFEMVDAEIQNPRKFGKTDNNDRNDTGNLYTEKEPQFKGYTDCGHNAGWNKGIVLDPFMGAGTVARVAMDLGRNYLGIELNPKYIEMANKRLAQQVLNF